CCLITVSVGVAIQIIRMEILTINGIIISYELKTKNKFLDKLYTPSTPIYFPKTYDKGHIF
ncbi:hypothetical protein ACJX0J_016984, partial [Zea mays]